MDGRPLYRCAVRHESAGAIAGIVIGNVFGFGLLGVLSTFGPRYGVPQMVASRLAFGWYGNAFRPP